MHRIYITRNMILGVIGLIALFFFLLWFVTFGATYVGAEPIGYCGGSYNLPCEEGFVCKYDKDNIWKEEFAQGTCVPEFMERLNPF